MTNTIDILTKNKNTSSEIINISDKEGSKNTPSLFDSLLKENLPETITTTTVASEINTEQKVKENSILNTQIVDTKIELSTVETAAVETNKIDTKPQSTVLDRLIIEAKSSNDVEAKQDSTQSSSLFDSLLKNNLNKDETHQEIKVAINDTKAEPLLQVQLQTQQVVTQDLPKQEIIKEPKNEVLEEIKVAINDTKVEPLVQSQPQVQEEVKITVEKKVISELEEKSYEEQTQESKDFSSIKEQIKIDISSEKVLEPSKIISEVEKTEVVASKNENKVDSISTLIETKIINDVVFIEETPVTISTKETINKDVDKSFAIDANILDTQTKPKEKKSLMDLLIQKNILKTETQSFDENNEFNKNELISKEIVSNIYLGTQKNILNNQILFNRNEAINLLKEGTTIKDVEKSADLLDLGLEEVEFTENITLQKTEVSKKLDVDFLSRRNLLDNLFLERNIKNDDMKNLISKSIDASSALVENSLNLSEDVTISVNAPLSYNIQSKIIGAKQQMSTMMSDIARQMYENYKPPISVFRINLNPLELGSIAIMMKSDKNNALSISMNISNNTTLEALVENQNILRNSLNKTFDENTKFNLDFSSSNQNNGNSSNNQNNQSKNKFENQGDTQTILQIKEENKGTEEKIVDYM